MQMCYKHLSYTFFDHSPRSTGSVSVVLNHPEEYVLASCNHKNKKSSYFCCKIHFNDPIKLAWKGAKKKITLKSRFGIVPAQTSS